MKINKVLNEAVNKVFKNVIGSITIIAVFIIIIQLKQIKNDEKFAIQELPNQEIQEEKVANKEVVRDKREKQSMQITSRYSAVRSRNIQEKQHEKIEEIEEEIVEVQYSKIEDITISREMDLTITTGISKEDFKLLISNVKYDTSKFFYDNSDYIYDLCQEYQINEIFFCGLISAESGWNIASNHRRTHNYISLMTRNGLIPYNSVEEGLTAAAKALHNNYLTEGGKFYHGKTLYGVKTKFCPASSTWVELVYGRMEQIIKSI